VYERPTNPFVGRFLGEANLIEGMIAPEGATNGAAEESGPLRLRLSSGAELRAPRGGDTHAGPGMLFIRPERVEILPGGAVVAEPNVNALVGKVRRCSFLGNILRYAVALEDDVWITVDLQNAAGVAPLPVGASVTLRWPVSDSLILSGAHDR
jgi:ABC-type Fe3+/spermidine/putrescine transport system ATPase subunit